MDSSHPRRHRSWFLAVISSAVLFLGSVAFASSASAQGAPSDPVHTNQGKSATAHAHSSAAPRHQARPSRHTTGGGGSAVSLAKPNDFQAQADPDGMTNGGVDQPGGTGGIDTTTQDGNNGSGNDVDCEDDNRGVGVPGHCKDKTDQSVDQTGDQTGDVPDDQTDVTPENSVVAESQLPVTTTTLQTLASQALAQVAAPLVAPDTRSPALTQDSTVSGVGITDASTSSGAQGAPRATATILPNTGAGAALLALLVGGLGAIAVGGGLLTRGRAHA